MRTDIFSYKYNRQAGSNVVKLFKKRNPHIWANIMRVLRVYLTGLCGLFQQLSCLLHP